MIKQIYELVNKRIINDQPKGDASKLELHILKVIKKSKKKVKKKMKPGKKLPGVAGGCSLVLSL